MSPTTPATPSTPSFRQPMRLQSTNVIPVSPNNKNEQLQMQQQNSSSQKINQCKSTNDRLVMICDNYDWNEFTENSLPVITYSYTEDISSALWNLNLIWSTVCYFFSFNNYFFNFFKRKRNL